MTTELLIAIRESSKRLRPAIARKAKLAPYREMLIKYFRSFSALQDIPISIGKRYRLYLHGTVHTNSKSGAVYNELTSSGTPIAVIWHAGLQVSNRYFKLIRLFYWLPGCLIIMMKKYKQLMKLDNAGRHVVMGYFSYKRLFTRYPHIVPIIISDVSPTLHMQWSAALSLKRNVLYWQDDYHHYQGFSKENYMPYSASHAALLNQLGLESVRSKNKDIVTFKRPETKVVRFRSISLAPRIGIATNAKFDANTHQMDFLSKIRKELNALHVYVRLHPNSNLTSRELYYPWISIAPQDETLEQYVQKVDLVIVGNSAVQLKLLCAGVPIIHTSGLDSYGFDLYGYCRKGFSYGLQSWDDTISVVDINSFYQDADRSERLYQYVNVHDQILPLKKLADQFI